jgi:dTDP-4-dehydrorhamnose 3,5-epimerase-like enzyme
VHTTPQIIELPKFSDERGNLSFIQHSNNGSLPFAIERVFWIYDVPGGDIRGGHSYKTQQELIVALTGSFDVVVHDGITEQKFHLNRSYFGLFVPAMCWRNLENFSTNALSLHLSDSKYNEADYIRDKNEFLVLKQSK